MALIFSAINWNAHFSQSLNFQHYSTDNGLPQSTVYDIVQDSAGFIWFGTEAGIGRFDGIKVKTYSLAEGLVGTNVWSLLWINMVRYGLEQTTVYHFYLKMKLEVLQLQTD